MRYRLFELRADAAAAMASPEAVTWYRAAIAEAPAADVPWLKARLARALIMANDVDGAADVMAGVEPTGGPEDGGILLVAGMLAYFGGELDRADELAEQARAHTLTPGAPSAPCSA